MEQKYCNTCFSKLAIKRKLLSEIEIRNFTSNFLCYLRVKVRRSHLMSSRCHLLEKNALALIFGFQSSFFVFSTLSSSYCSDLVGFQMIAQA